MENEETLESGEKYARARLRWWIGQNAQRDLLAAVLLAGFAAIVLPLGREQHWILFGLIVVLMILLEVRQSRTYRRIDELVKDRTRAEIVTFAEQLQELPFKQRTLPRLEALCNGTVEDDGLTCFERGKHTPSCPHRANDS